MPHFSTKSSTSELDELALLDLRLESNLTEVEDHRQVCCATCRQRCPRVLIVFLLIYVMTLVLFMTVALMLRKHAYSPHVVLIVVDDLGWGDVEWQDADMRTPVLRQLLQQGVLLQNSYAHPLDSPSRAAIFSGLYPHHMGLQHENMDPYVPAYVPANVTLLPKLLQTAGYRTYMVGKWHLGFCNWGYTPLPRGFDNFAGFYTGEDLDYYSHRDARGYFDFRSKDVVDFGATDQHSTKLLTDRALDFIFNHDVSKPMFLVVAYQAIHTPASLPEHYVNQTCGHVTEGPRRTVCGLAAMVDEGVGNVTAMLRSRGLQHNAVIIITSDNGGVIQRGSSNGQLRGSHGDLYEGGTRVVSLVTGDLVSAQGQTFNGLFHQVDWLPTILAIAGVPQPADVDGVNQWPAISTNGPGPRTELVYNIDEHYSHAVIRVEDFKLIEGNPNFTSATPNSTELQLFNLATDPSESLNLAAEMPEKVESMINRLDVLKASLIPSTDKTADPNADPQNFNNLWSPGWC